MNRKELVRGVTEYLYENNVRKTVSSPKHVFTVSDDTGASKDFVVKQSEKRVSFNMTDVDSVLDAILEVIYATLKHGDKVAIRGLGEFGLRYRKPFRNVHPQTGEWTILGGNYKPVFTPGRQFKLCAKVYELSEKEKEETAAPADPDGDEDAD